MLLDLLRIDPIEIEPAFLGVIEPHQQIDDGRFPASGRADKGDLMAFIDIEGEVIDDLLLLGIAEVQMLSF